MGLGAKHWYWRVAGGVVGVVLLVELVRTVARGAWVAVVVAVLVLAAFVAPELRRRAPVIVGGAVGGARGRSRRSGSFRAPVPRPATLVAVPKRRRQLRLAAFRNLENSVSHRAKEPSCGDRSG